VSADATPPVLEGFDAARFEGRWSIVATNYGYWKSRTHPSVSYERLAGERVTWKDTLHFRAAPWWGGAARDGTLGGVDVQDARVPSHFVWRGDGMLRVIKSPWWVVMVGAEYDWAVTYFGRSNVGTAAGMDLYFRKPDPEPDAVAEVMARVRAHAFLATRCSGMFATVQDGVAADRYQF
jgi:hypothetical protein